MVLKTQGLNCSFKDKRKNTLHLWPLMWLNMSQMLLARRLYCDFLPIFIKRCDRCGSSSNLELISTQEVKIDSYGIHDKLLLTPDELPNIYWIINVLLKVSPLCGHLVNIPGWLFAKFYLNETLFKYRNLLKIQKSLKLFGKIMFL